MTSDRAAGRRKRVAFVSNIDALSSPAAVEFVRALQGSGWSVTASPAGHGDSQLDPRWADWYDSGLAEAVAKSDAFIAFIPNVDIYGSSTWMAIEFEEALRRQHRHQRPCLFVYKTDVRALPAGFDTYIAAAVELPTDTRAAALTVTEQAAREDS